MTRKIQKIGARIHILCNGEKSEYEYFCSLSDALRKARQICIPSPVKKNLKGLAPWDLIKKAIEYKANISFEEEDGDQVWCVFDVDDYWDHNKKKFEEAIQLAEKNGIHLAWSNRCFELWLLLHFQILSGEIPPNQYSEKLKQAFKKHKIGTYKPKDYKSNFENIYIFKDLAIKHASQLEQSINNNPSTNLHSLMQVLFDL